MGAPARARRHRPLREGDARASCARSDARRARGDPRERPARGRHEDASSPPRLDEFANVFQPTGEAGQPGRSSTWPASRTSSAASARVEKTQQITRAMRMVAAAKLRRAQDAIWPRARTRSACCATLAEVGRARSRTRRTRCSRARPRAQALEVLVVTSDRGLCGAFNANVLKRAEAALASARPEARAGQRSRRWAARRASSFAPRAAALERAGPPVGGVDVRLGREIAAAPRAPLPRGEIDEVVLVVQRVRLRASRSTPRVVAAAAVPGLARRRSPTGEAPALRDRARARTTLLDVLVPKALEVDDLPRAAREPGGRARRAHGRDGERDAQHRGADPQRSRCSSTAPARPRSPRS